MLCGGPRVFTRDLELCSSWKYTYRLPSPPPPPPTHTHTHTMKGQWKIPRERGRQNKKKHGAKLEFLEGWGCKPKTLPCEEGGGGWIFSRTTQLPQMLSKFNRFCYFEMAQYYGLTDNIVLPMIVQCQAANCMCRVWCMYNVLSPTEIDYEIQSIHSPHWSPYSSYGSGWENFFEHQHILLWFSILFPHILVLRAVCMNVYQYYWYCIKEKLHASHS